MIIITPNPTTSNANAKLLSHTSIFKGMKVFPLSVRFQLLFDQKIIHQ
jgi:hypothetical protein